MLDLDERLKTFIQKVNPKNELSSKCGLGFVPPSGKMSLQMDPGSKAIETYWNGNEEMAMNFELALNGVDYPSAREALAPVIDELTSLKEDEVVSSNGSFEFDHIEVTGMPFNQVIDLDGSVYWLTNFICYVTKINNKEAI